MDITTQQNGYIMPAPHTWEEFIPYLTWLWSMTTFTNKMFLGLLVLMSLDIITGVISARAIDPTKLSSKVSFVGISKKAMTVLAIFAARIFLAAVPEILPNLDLPSVPVLMTTIVVWYQVNEMISIHENYRKMGLSIPIISPLIKKLQELLAGVTGNGNPPSPPLPPAPTIPR